LKKEAGMKNHNQGRKEDPTGQKAGGEGLGHHSKHHRSVLVEKMFMKKIFRDKDKGTRWRKQRKRDLQG
jgi:hypothetical protein